MASLALDAEGVGSELYLALGLKGKHNGAIPRVLSIISSLLERSVQRNEKLLETGRKKEVVTVFHGLRAPALSIPNYLERIFKYSSCSPSCFVVADIYMDRYIHSVNTHLTSLNVHRMLITSVMVAAKFIDDAFCNNAYYARVGGVSTAEMNRLEMNFLFSLDFRLHVTVDTFRRHCLQLEKETIGSYQIERPIQKLKLKEVWHSVEDATCTVNIQTLSCGSFKFADVKKALQLLYINVTGQGRECHVPKESQLFRSMPTNTSLHNIMDSRTHGGRCHLTENATVSAIKMSGYIPLLRLMRRAKSTEVLEAAYVTKSSGISLLLWPWKDQSYGIMEHQYMMRLELSVLGTL